MALLILCFWATWLANLPKLTPKLSTTDCSWSYIEDEGSPSLANLARELAISRGGILKAWQP